MQRRLIAILLVAAVVAPLIGFTSAFNRRALNGSAHWGMQTMLEPQAAAASSVGTHRTIVHPSPDSRSDAARSAQQPAQPWLGWVFIAFMVALFLAVRSSLLIVPEQADRHGR